MTSGTSLDVSLRPPPFDDRIKNSSLQNITEQIQWVTYVLVLFGLGLPQKTDAKTASDAREIC